ncbi:MAG: 4Fe-4S binding protein [Oscillospiraceae bacterium]|jgi:NAD-dependent dihydropyrimidine dehydrogenase PreA subunit|nr:4Fe-4S binding protein [Oscillospiraceae bacterium]
MAHKITDECVSCGSCAGRCPVEAISAGKERFEIDPEKCIDCGVCAEQCPVSAIKAE